jgi:hypothetical protein
MAVIFFTAFFYIFASTNHMKICAFINAKIFKIAIQLNNYTFNLNQPNLWQLH